MKKQIILALSFLTTLSAFAADPSKLVFSRDLRMTDGALTQIIVEKNEGSVMEGTYDVTKHTDGRLGKNNETLAEFIDCAISDDVSSVVCKRDARRTDGGLMIIEIKADEYGEYAATLTTQGRLDSKPKTETVGSGLKLTAQK